jgi:hypothetical protein
MTSAWDVLARGMAKAWFQYLALSRVITIPFPRLSVDLWASCRVR